MIKAHRLTRLVLVLAFALCDMTTPVQAKEAAPLAADLVVEKRMVEISEELRCLVCQNESLAGSHAELAEDLRREIRVMIKQNKSNDEIMEFMVSRYGDFVRYRPPMNASTYLLWFGPFLLLAGAIIALMLYLRQRSGRVEDAAESQLTAEERQQADNLIKQNGNT